MKKKILFFNYEYPPLGGGAANATAYILAEYAKLPDLEVDLVTSSVDSEFHLEQIGANIRVHKLPIGKNSANLHFQSQVDLLIYMWKAWWFSRKLIQKEKYNLSHSFFTVPCGLISLVHYWLYDLPYVVSLRGSDVPGYSDRFGFVYQWLSPLFGYIWQKAAAVVSNSEGLRELALKTRPQQAIDIIYNGIDVVEFRPETSRRPVDKFILTPGASRVTARKGLNYLIEAVAQLAPQYPQLQLRIMGDGNERENLEALVKQLKLEKSVEFLGRVPHEKVLPYYQEASAFVLPSLNEGMSNAMLEALATGLPLIATDCGGSKELITEGENGLFIRMADAKDIAEKIERLLRDAELVKKMGAHSRARAEELSWKKVAKKYYDVYQKIEQKN